MSKVNDINWNCSFDSCAVNMERRERLFCFCFYLTITAIGFLIALLIAYKTLTGECEHPEDICYHEGKCYFDYRGFICVCGEQYYGERCEYRKHTHLPANQKDSDVTQKYVSDSNTTSAPGLHISGQPVVILTPSSSPKPTKPSEHKGQDEVAKSPVKRDTTLGPPYWKFIIVFGTGCSLFFIIAYVFFNVINRTNCMGMDNSKSKDFYGIKYEQAAQAGQSSQLLISSNASNLDNNV